MIKGICLFLIFITTSSFLIGQDTIHHRRGFPALGYVIPGIFISTGVVINNNNTKQGFRDFIRKHYEVSNTNIDDYLQYAPIVMMYTSDLSLHRKKEEVERQTRHMIVSQASTILTVYTLKSVINSRRPNGGKHSFPSGHTAYAFACAHVMYHSFKNDHLWLAYSGFIPAIVTGAFRILKDKHWISDVLTGAGLGILFSQITYHYDIWNSGSSKAPLSEKNVQMTVNASPGSVGLSVRF